MSIDENARSFDCVCLGVQVDNDPQVDAQEDAVAADAAPSLLVQQDVAEGGGLGELGPDVAEGGGLAEPGPEVAEGGGLAEPGPEVAEGGGLGELVPQHAEDVGDAAGASPDLDRAEIKSDPMKPGPEVAEGGDLGKPGPVSETKDLEAFLVDEMEHSLPFKEHFFSLSRLCL